MHDPRPRPRRDGWHGPLEVLVDESLLARRVAELGAQIGRDYAGGELCAVGVLKGSVPFFADLVRAIPLPLTCEFIGISSYGDGHTTTGRVQITQPPGRSVAGKDVLLVEDIVDSGLSMRFLLEHFRSVGARSVAACSLLAKHSRRQVEVEVAYVGFSIADHFVVGYGLDSQGRLRNVPFVGVVPPAAG